MNISSLRFLSIALCFLLLSPVPSRPQEKGDEKKSQEVLERFKVHRHGDALIVPVTFKGKEYQFLVDTGASATVYDLSLPLGEAKGKIEVRGAEGPAAVSIFAGQKYNIGKLTFGPGDSSLGIDFTKLREVSGYPIYGVIGMDFLSNCVLQIDFDEGQLLFLKKVAPRSGNAFPLNVSLLGLSLELGVHDIRDIGFLVDTGSYGVGGIDLEEGIISGLEKKNELRVVGRALATTAKGISSHRVLQGKKMSMGEIAIANPVFTEGRYNLIGLNFLSRFKVTFDFPGNKLYLQKGKRFQDPDLWDVSGLHILRKQGNTVVDSVDKGSTAASGGVQAGDKILKVGDNKAEEMSLFELRRLCCKRGSTLNLTIERQGRSLEVKVDLKSP